MSEYNQIQAKLINALNRKVVKHKTVYKSDNSVILIDDKTKYYYTIHRIGNTNMGILIPSNMDNTKANCWYIVGKNLFDDGGKPDAPKYVDLGLSSGILWLTEDIKDSDGNELYFAWGETTGYSSSQVGTERVFNQSSYTYTDNPTVLPATNDIVTILYGSGYKMPEANDWKELLESCSKSAQEGGVMFTSFRNGNKLFFPYSGHCNATGLVNFGNMSYYWSSSINEGNTTQAWYVRFNASQHYRPSDARFIGNCIRGIKIR